jgi:predicted ATPase
MITRLQIRNYKALRDVTLNLTPIHVLIGPNDSGKTSVLEAIAALCRSVETGLAAAFSVSGRWEGLSLVWNQTPNLGVEFLANMQVGDGAPYINCEYGLECSFAATGKQVHIESEWANIGESKVDLTHRGHGQSAVHRLVTEASSNLDEKKRAAELVADALRGVQTYRFVPRFLALPAATESSRRFRMAESGFGLATCLDDILGYDRNRFGNLEARFRSIFPDVASIKLISQKAYHDPSNDPEQIPRFQNAEGKGIFFQFNGNENLVAAAQVSDGVLLVLAYLALLYLPEPPRVLLMEEPENGIHPKRLQDVMKILRELIAESQGKTQVVLTTHSPYLVDLFEPAEVTLCQKQDDGSVALRRLSESETVRKQLSVFTLGEIWTGEGDSALYNPAPGSTESQP